MCKTVQAIKNLSLAQILAMRFLFGLYRLRYYSCQTYWYFNNAKVGNMFKIQRKHQILSD